MPKDMILLTKTFDLLAWLGPRTDKFPKNQRHGVTERLLGAVLDFQEALFDAISQSGTTRQKHLRTAEAHLNKLRLYLRLAHRWKWLNDGQYNHVSVMVAEIGRMLGGWIKTRTSGDG